MNRKVLDELANWMIDCLIGKDIIKSNKIENVYKKMFDRQFDYHKPSIKQLFEDMLEENKTIIRGD